MALYDILPVTKVIGPTAIMTWNIEEFIAHKHKNNDITTKVVLVAQLL